MHLPVRGTWKFNRSTLVLTFNGKPIEKTFFDRRPSGYHGAVDIPSSDGDILRAMDGGTIDTYAWNDYWGRYLTLEHKIRGNKKTHKLLMAHLQKSYVSSGKRVSSGQNIGRTDNTGYSTGSHLHLEWWWTSADRDSRVDPYWLLCWLTEKQQGRSNHINPYRPPPRSSVLKIGDTGYDVMWTQWALGKLKVNGVFDHHTDRVLRSFQSKSDLKITGRVDLDTRKALKSVTR